MAGMGRFADKKRKGGDKMAGLKKKDKRGVACRAAIIDYIRQYTMQHRESPSYREIGTAIGRSQRTVNYHLQMLEKDGIVAYEDSRIRTVYIVGDYE